MPTLDYYQIDAFTDRVFSGNPAAVYVLSEWLDDRTLQQLASEHQLSETAFVVPGPDNQHALRWFTPTCEVALCGHATLASAHVLLHCQAGFNAPLTFTTRHAGALGVTQADDLLWLDFPAQAPTPVADDEQPAIHALNTAMGIEAAGWQRATNYLAIYDSADQVAALDPNMQALALYGRQTDLGFIATAPADDGQHDFVSRYFVPSHGVDEDPVTGSAHCTLAPYWAARLDRTELSGRQISARGGSVHCHLVNDRVHLGGQAVVFARGTAYLPD